jgi:aldehyde dehydrogenase (NAD+)
MNLSDLMKAQRAYFDQGNKRPVIKRLEALDRLYLALQARENDVSAALKQDLNKQPFEAYETELGIVYAELRYVRRHLARWTKPKRVPTPLAHFPSQSRIYQDPYGVVLIMAPWNYPVQLTLVPLISALAAGNCAVVKPSAYAPATSALLAELLSRTFPPDYVSVVEGGRAENTALLEQPFDSIFFTGSPAVGKTVMTAAAKHLTPVTLELGGKSPVIIAKDADLDLAARRIVWGKFLNAGQTCVAPDHVWVPRDQLDQLVNLLGKYIVEFYSPFPLQGSDLPKIINETHFDRLLGLLQSGKVAQGGRYDREQRRIEPTVLVDVTEADPVMGEEIFGPILPVLPYDDLDELIVHLQGKAHPLALYLFTRSNAIERKVLGQLQFGGGCVNDTVVHLATSYLPFGGVGNSGMGRCHGKYGFDTFTHQKSVLKKGRLDVPLRYPPYDKAKIPLLKKFM